MTHTASLTAQGSARCSASTTAAASVGMDVAGFLQLQARVENLQRQVDEMGPKDGKPAKPGFHKKRDRLMDAKTALLDAENKLNRK